VIGVVELAAKATGKGVEERLALEFGICGRMERREEWVAPIERGVGGTY
jgi:hypothetical protein